MEYPVWFDNQMVDRKVLLLVNRFSAYINCHRRICTWKNRDLFATIDEDSKLRKRKEEKEAETVGFWGRNQVRPVQGPMGPIGLSDWLMEMRPDPHINMVKELLKEHRKRFLQRITIKVSAS